MATWAVAKSKCVDVDPAAEGAWQEYSADHSALLEKRRANGELLCHLDGVHTVDLERMRQLRMDDEESWRAVQRREHGGGAALSLSAAPEPSPDIHVPAAPEVPAPPKRMVAAPATAWAVPVAAAPEPRRLDRAEIMFIAKTCQQAGLYEEMAAELERLIDDVDGGADGEGRKELSRPERELLFAAWHQLIDSKRNAARAVEEQLQDMRATARRGSPRMSPGLRGATTRAEDLATVSRYWHGLQDEVRDVCERVSAALARLTLPSSESGAASGSIPPSSSGSTGTEKGEGGEPAPAPPLAAVPEAQIFYKQLRGDCLR